MMGTCAKSTEGHNQATKCEFGKSSALYFFARTSSTHRWFAIASINGDICYQFQLHLLDTGTPLLL